MESVTQIALVVNGDVHPLDRGTDVRDLQEAIVAAVQAGGGFVDIRGARDQVLSVLVNASTALLISKAVYPDNDLPQSSYFDGFGGERDDFDDLGAE